MVPVDLCVHFWWEILKFNGWCYFWWGTCQWHPKMLNLQQKCNGLERKFFEPNGTNCPCTWPFWLRFVMLWSSGHQDVQSLQKLLLSMTSMSKYGWFTCLPWTKPDWLPSVGHNLLRPTSNSSKHTPEILRCLVSWVSKVLCLIPDSFSSWDLSHVWTWCMHEDPFHSSSYPSRHWSAMSTPGLP